MNLVESLLHALKDHGARQIFGIPGDFALPYFRIIEQTGILPLYTLSHEPAVGFAADASAMADVDPAVAQEVYGRVYQWFAENAAVITDSGAELLGAETATTVKSGGVLVDGPFSEAKEVIGGFSVIDVPDLDAALDEVGAHQMLTRLITMGAGQQHGKASLRGRRVQRIDALGVEGVDDLREH